MKCYLCAIDKKTMLIWDLLTGKFYGKYVFLAENCIKLLFHDLAELTNMLFCYSA